MRSFFLRPWLTIARWRQAVAGAGHAGQQVARKAEAVVDDVGEEINDAQEVGYISIRIKLGQSGLAKLLGHLPGYDANGFVEAEIEMPSTTLKRTKGTKHEHPI